MKITAFLAGAILASLVSACATTTATVTQQLDARNTDATALRSITVLGFSGSYGEVFADRLEASLVSAKLESGEPYFDVKERKSQQSRSGAGATFRGTSAEVQAAVDYGKLTGVQGVYFGAVDANVDRSSYTGSRQYCVRQEDGKCKEWGRRNVSCSKLIANVTASPKVVDVSSADTVYARTLATSSEYSWCSGDQRTKSDEILLSEAIQIAIGDIRKDVAPWMTQVNVALKNRSETMNEQDKAAFSGAAEFARANRLDRACGIYDSLKANNDQNPDLLYNLGVCAESTQNFELALQYYTMADAQLIKPDTQINQALERARALMAGEEYIPTPENPLSSLFQSTSNAVRDITN